MPWQPQGTLTHSRTHPCTASRRKYLTDTRRSFSAIVCRTMDCVAAYLQLLLEVTWYMFMAVASMSNSVCCYFNFFILFPLPSPPHTTLLLSSALFSFSVFLLLHEGVCIYVPCSFVAASKPQRRQIWIQSGTLNGPATGKVVIVCIGTTFAGPKENGGQSAQRLGRWNQTIHPISIPIELQNRIQLNF